MPWLTAEGYLRVDEANQLFRFYTRATEVNRSLDDLATMISAPGLPFQRCLRVKLGRNWRQAAATRNV